VPDNPRDIRIRPAEANDLPFVLTTAERLSSFGPPPWRTAAEVVEGEAKTLRAFFASPTPGSTLLVAESAEAGPLGFAFLESLHDYFTREPHGHIGVLSVSQEGQGRGVGGALLRAAEGWARERGFRRLTLAVFEGNRHARAVYEHVGYAPEVLRYVKFLTP
jgi:GNAT superfamily N-acetyltransferase